MDITLEGEESSFLSLREKTTIEEMIDVMKKMTQSNDSNNYRLGETSEPQLYLHDMLTHKKLSVL